MLPRHLALGLTALAVVLVAPTAAVAQQPHGQDPALVDGAPERPWDDDPAAMEQDISAAGTPAPPEPAPSGQPAAILPPAPVIGPPDRSTPPAARDAEPTGPPLVTTATVPGRVAMLRTDGRAAIPRGAPKAVRLVIAAANQIVGKPYKWGGGHARLVDRGYDCSGTVSYALIRAGLLRSPLVSGALARWSAPGAGRWMTVYANGGHVYLEVAGLRLDTSGVGDRRSRSGPRWRPLIGARPRFAARHVRGL